MPITYLDEAPKRSRITYLDEERADSIGPTTFLEPAATVVSSAVAEPLAGIAGVVQAANPFVSEGAGARAVEATREALTYQPRTTKGKSGLRAVGEALEPIGEVIKDSEQYLGDTMFKVTGSPTLAAAAASIPTAVLETIGLKGGSKIAKSSAKVEPSTRAMKKALTQSALPPNDLKQISRNIYTELGEFGVTIKPKSYSSAVKDIRTAAKKSGLSKRVTKQAFGLIEDLEEQIGKKMPLSELDDLRKVANNLSKSIDKTEASIGGVVVDKIDDFLDNLKAKDLVAGELDAKVLGAKYKAARNLWGRAKKSEEIMNIMEVAKIQASGYENGLRIGFRALLKNQKKIKFFNEAEKTAIRDLVDGDVAQNTAKFLGRFAFNEGQATNIIGGLAASGIGYSFGGLPGMAVTGAVGQGSRQIAQRLTRNKAKFVDSMVRAGNDGEKIARVYMTAVPKSQRSIKELSGLLSDPNVDLSNLVGKSNKLIKEATEVAVGRRTIGQAIGIAAAGAASGSNNRR